MDFAPAAANPAPKSDDKYALKSVQLVIKKIESREISLCKRWIFLTKKGYKRLQNMALTKTYIYGVTYM